MSNSVDPDELMLGQAVLPHGGTVADFRLRRAQWARMFIERRRPLLVMTGSSPKEWTPEEFAQFEILVESSANAWGIVALLEWLGREFGAGTAYRAAALLQEIGVDGEPYDETLLEVPGLDEAGDPVVMPS